MNAQGTNTAHKTRATATTGPVTSSIALRGRVAGRQPLLEPAFDVLDDDDRVVHHDPDRQHQPEQRDVVEAENPIAAMTAKVPTMATGTATSGIEHRSPVLKEGEHHQPDQHHRLEQGLHRPPRPTGE